MTKALSNAVAGLMLFCIGNMFADSNHSGNDFIVNRAIISPNGKFECALEWRKGEKAALYVRSLGYSNSKRVLLWSSARSISGRWGPGCKWLAIIDSHSSGENAILIFDMSQSGFPLIFQTPDSSEEWEILAWDEKASAVKLKGVSRFSRKESVTQWFSLSKLPIEQTLYEDDPREANDSLRHSYPSPD